MCLGGCGGINSQADGDQLDSTNSVSHGILDEQVVCLGLTPPPSKNLHDLINGKQADCSVCVPSSICVAAAPHCAMSLGKACCGDARVESPRGSGAGTGPNMHMPCVLILDTLISDNRSTLEHALMLPAYPARWRALSGVDCSGEAMSTTRKHNLQICKETNNRNGMQEKDQYQNLCHWGNSNSR